MSKISVKVKYSNYYNLISKLNYININIFNIKKHHQYLILTINSNDYDKLCKYIVSYKFTIYKSMNYKFILNYLKCNISFLFSIVISIFLFLFLNYIIVDIDIIHENSNIVNIIERELISNNVKALTFKKSYEKLESIKESILEKYPDKLDWIEIEIVGMKYIVRVEERIITNENITDTYCNVYAEKSGLITDLYVEEGIAVVSRGDYVAQGDLLITGDIALNDEIKNEVCAKGIVKVEKWYETDISLPINYFEDEITDNNRYNLLLEYDNKEIKLLNDRLDNYITDEKILFDLFGYKLILQNNLEIERKYKKYTEEEGINKALDLVEEKMLLKLKEGEKILDKKVLINNQNNSTIELRVFIITEEVIS